LAGNALSAEARAYEGALMVTLKKTIAKSGFFGGEAPYTGAVDVAVSPALRSGDSNAETPPVFLHRLFFSLENAEEYRFSVPFDSEELVIVLQTEKNTLKLTVKPE
jgi:hypothetical protein